KTIARKKTKEGEPENKSKDEDKKADKKEFKFENKKDAKRNIEEHHKPHFFYGSDIFAYGYPFNADTIESQSEYAFARERYGELNADPLFLIGADLRPTLLFRDNRSKFFPMQVELGTAIHPIEHLTISATGAVQGRKKGFSESTKRLKLQNAYILAHEFPFMSYLQAGFFLPSFGIRHDDHTAPTRKYFDMDQSVERNTVLGVEMGMAPNYPYLSFSLFKNRKKDDPYSYTGYGMSFTGGWRDLLWGAGVSFMHKKRNIEDYGNLTAFGVNGYFNLGRIILRVPLVFQGEFNVGQKPRNILNQKKSFLAAYLQADYILVNGLDFKLAYHYFLDDLDLKIDNYVRYTFGIDYNIINNIKLTTELRYTLTSNRDTIQDMLIFFHFYL
ncbi:MAG: hypothetical protein OEV44_12650, partial [Spirochaetota bacterium]|nr:hypothetical protein [Spirochaetota bacterium]